MPEKKDSPVFLKPKKYTYTLDLFRTLLSADMLTQSNLDLILKRYALNLPCTEDYFFHVMKMNQSLSQKWGAFFELLKRDVQTKHEQTWVSCPKDFVDYMRSHCVKSCYENFYVGLLNSQGVLTAVKKLFEGGVDCIDFNFKVFLKFILLSDSSRVIICHNHPSGDVSPSEADIKLTQKIKLHFEPLNIDLLDHIIMGEKKYYSFTNKKTIYF